MSENSISRKQFVIGASALAAGAAVAGSIAAPLSAIADEDRPPIETPEWFDNPTYHVADGEVAYGKKNITTFGEGCDKVWIITGAARGIGKEIARRFVRKGHVVLYDILKEDLFATRDELERESIYSVTAMNGDVRDPEQVKALADLVKSMGYKLGGVVNNAGICGSQGYPDEIFATNFMGTVYVTEAFMDMCNPGTVIVNIGSCSSDYVAETPEVVAMLEDPHSPDIFANHLELCKGDPAAAYYYSKLAVKIYTRNLALPLGQMGARIVSIGPGLIDTPMGDLVIGTFGELIDYMWDHETCALPRIGTPIDIANMAEFLASDACAWCTGYQYRVDGGTTIPFDYVPYEIPVQE